MRSLRTVYRGHRAFPLVLDTLLVIVFAAVGRASHGEPVTPAGIFETGWPFVIALLVGWGIATVLRARVPFVWPAGVVIWVVTVAGGMGLRLATGGTAATAFVVVATVVLGLSLLLPRAILGGAREPSGHTRENPVVPPVTATTPEVTTEPANSTQPETGTVGV